MQDKDNFLNDEWGNIGPDSIHDPKWSRKKTLAERNHQSAVLKEKYKDPKFKNKVVKANKEKHKRLANDPEWQKKMVKVNKIKGINTKKRFEDKEYTRKYGEQISKNKNPVSPELAFILWNKIHEKGNKNSRSLKNYKKLAKEHNVPLTQIHAIANGQHYAFGGELIYKGSKAGIRINQTEINVEKERLEWYRSWFGTLEFISPKGKSYAGFTNYRDASTFMIEQEGIIYGEKTVLEAKSLKKFGKLQIGEQTIGQLQFWKDWIFKRNP